MQTKLRLSTAGTAGRPWHLTVTALALVLSLGATGCLSSLSRHSVALNTATRSVAEGSAQAYSTANHIHNLRVDYDAVAAFDTPAPVYNPRTTQPLLSDQAIQVRLATLAALQAYAQSLVNMTRGVTSPDLDDAATSVGSNLGTLGNNLAPSIETTLGIAAADDPSTPPAPITPTVRNGISVGVQALGQYLVSRKIKSELPQVIGKMDPHVQLLCTVLADDIAIIQAQELRDYNRIINQQTLFLRNPALHLDDQLRREQIMKLPRVVREHSASDEQLADLKASITRLALTHSALAAAAQKNNPESLKSQIGELSTAGKSLGTYYSSLSTQ